MQDLAPKRDEAILDLGCGDGELADVIQQHGAKVLGIDSSASLIAAAHKRGLANSVRFFRI